MVPGAHCLNETEVRVVLTCPLACSTNSGWSCARTNKWTMNEVGVSALNDEAAGGVAMERSERAGRSRSTGTLDKHASEQGEQPRGGKAIQGSRTHNTDRDSAGGQLARELRLRRHSGVRHAFALGVADEDRGVRLAKDTTTQSGKRFGPGAEPRTRE